MPERERYPKKPGKMRVDKSVLKVARECGMRQLKSALGTSRGRCKNYVNSSYFRVNPGERVLTSLHGFIREHVEVSPQEGIK